MIHRDLDDMNNVLNGFVYQKAGFFLHMLRGLVGDEAFWRGIREYYRRHRDAHATTADFLRTMEQASGRELRSFLDQWLRRSGVPRLEGTWRYDSRRQQVEVAVEQTQAGEPYRLPIEVGLVFRKAGARCGAPRAIGPPPGRDLRVGGGALLRGPRPRHVDARGDRPPAPALG